MKFIFDKGTEKQRELDMDMFNEQVVDHRLAANLNLIVNEETEFPDLTEFVDNLEFETLEIRGNGGIRIPLVRHYSSIVGLAQNFYDENRRYNLSMTIT